MVDEHSQTKDSAEVSEVAKLADWLASRLTDTDQWTTDDYEDLADATLRKLTAIRDAPRPVAPIVKRPYWLLDSNVEAGVYLGFTKSEWPIQAFSAKHTHHPSWAAEKPVARVLLGPIAIPDHADVWTGQTIPKTHVLRRWGTDGDDE